MASTERKPTIKAHDRLRPRPDSALSVDSNGRRLSKYGQFVELYVRGYNLITLDYFTQSDPQVRLFTKQSDDQWLEIGRTETIDNCANPQWRKTFILPWQPASPLRFVVIDIDSEKDALEHHDYIGELECTLGDILAGDGMSVLTPLKFKNEPSSRRGTLSVIAYPLNDDSLRSVEVLQILRKMRSAVKQPKKITIDGKKYRYAFTGLYGVEWLESHVLKVKGERERAMMVCSMMLRVGYIVGDANHGDLFEDTPDHLYGINPYFLEAEKAESVSATASLMSQVTNAYVPVVLANNQAVMSRDEDVFNTSLSRPSLDDFLNTSEVKFAESDRKGSYPVLVAGTVAGIVDRLVYPRHQDLALRAAFLITFRLFTNACDVIDHLVDRFMDPSPILVTIRRKSRVLAAECERIVQVRIVGFLKTWITSYYEKDFHDKEEVMAKLTHFTSVVLQETNHSEWAESLVQSLRREQENLLINSADNEPATNGTAEANGNGVSRNSSASSSGVASTAGSSEGAPADNTRRADKAQTEAAPPLPSRSTSNMSVTAGATKRPASLALPATMSEYVKDTPGSPTRSDTPAKPATTPDRSAGPVTNVLNVSPMDFAQQLALVEHELAALIDQDELFGQKWMKKSKREEGFAPNVMRVIDHFNTISQWVGMTVVSEPGLAERGALIEHFLKIAACSVDIGNFNGAMEILGGLSVSFVTRLKKTWGVVNTRRGASDRHKMLQTLLSAQRNYSNLRKKLEQSPGPATPYMGTFLSDLVFIEDANPNVTEEGLINFKKYFMLAKTISSIQRFQDVPYPYEVKENIREFILELRPPFDEDEAYAHSLEVEPRIRPPPDINMLADENVFLKSEVLEMRGKVGELESQLAKMNDDNERLSCEVLEMRRLLMQVLEKTHFGSGESRPNGTAERADAYTRHQIAELSQPSRASVDLDAFSKNSKRRHSTLSTMRKTNMFDSYGPDGSPKMQSNADDGSDDSETESLDGVLDPFDENHEIFMIIEERLASGMLEEGDEGLEDTDSDSGSDVPLPPPRRGSNATTVMTPTAGEINARSNTFSNTLSPRDNTNKGKRPAGQGGIPSDIGLFGAGMVGRDDEEFESGIYEELVTPKGEDSGDDVFLYESDDGMTSETGSFTGEIDERPARPASAVTESMTGWLYKVGDRRKGWKRRYFVLGPKTLMYYANPSSGRPLNVIPLDGCFIMPCVTLARNLCFQLHHPVRRTFYLSADSHLDRLSWMEAIRTEIPGGGEASLEMLEAQGGVRVSPQNKPSRFGFRAGSSTSTTSQDVYANVVKTPAQQFETRAAHTFTNPANAGFLIKRGGTTTNWKKRFFVLQQGVLVYYKKDMDDKPLGVIALTAGHSIAAAAEGENFGKEFCFVLAHPTTRTYYLVAESQRLMEQWIATIDDQIPN